MQVLVADDDAVTAALLEGVLRSSGYEPVSVANGAEALAILKQGTCQLVLADWEMPGMTGPELCRAVRDGSFEHYVYIILITGHASPQHTLDGLNSGADDFVAKPFNPPEVICRLRVGERLLHLETAEMTIFALAKLAESRDPDTGAHLERVRCYSRVLAEHLRAHPEHGTLVTPAYVRLIYQTSPLHDIGKVAIPDAVLLKPDRLTDDEFEIMKTHTLHGAATLEAAMVRYPNAEFLHMAREISLTHHERFDGSGYPLGLAGDEIPLSGRIVALADVYDALTSKRVYKDAFGHDIAREVLQRERGSHFDPAVVEAFNQVEAKFIEIRHSFRDELSTSPSAARSQREAA